MPAASASRRFRRRTLSAIGLAAVSALSGGCGGGGGGGGGSGGPAAPGTLSALAVEGAFAPGGGSYLGFPADMLLSAAEGGWVAFVGHLTGTSASKALYVAQPDGLVLRVFGVGEVVPASNGATGTFADFRRVFVRPGGIVVVDADTSGGGRGFFSARGNSSGGIVEKACAARLGLALPAVIGGTIADVSEATTVVTGDARILFHATSSNGIHGLFRVDRAGATLDPIAYTGQSTGSETFGIDFRAVGVDASGTFFVFVAALNGASAEGLVATNDRTTFTLIAKNGDTPPDSGARPFTDVASSARLCVSWAGGNQPAFVTWRGSVAAGPAGSGVFRRAFWNAGVFTLAPIDAVVGAGEPLVGVGAGAFASDAHTLDGEQGPGSVVVFTAIAGGTTEHVVARLSPATGAIAETFRAGTSAPGGAAFGPGYPSLATTESNDACDRLGSFASSAILSDGSSGVFWDLASAGRVAVALQGFAAPGTSGAQFGSFAAPSAVSAAVGVVAFRAALVGGSGFSGVFRQH